jgi:hypothetical protein
VRSTGRIDLVKVSQEDQSRSNSIDQNLQCSIARTKLGSMGKEAPSIKNRKYSGQVGNLGLSNKADLKKNQHNGSSVVSDPKVLGKDDQGSCVRSSVGKISVVALGGGLRPTTGMASHEMILDDESCHQNFSPREPLEHVQTSEQVKYGREKSLRVADRPAEFLPAEQKTAKDFLGDNGLWKTLNEFEAAGEKYQTQFFYKNYDPNSDGFKGFLSGVCKEIMDFLALTKTLCEFADVGLKVLQSLNPIALKPPKLPMARDLASRFEVLLSRTPGDRRKSGNRTKNLQLPQQIPWTPEQTLKGSDGYGKTEKLTSSNFDCCYGLPKNYCNLYNRTIQGEHSLSYNNYNPKVTPWNRIAQNSTRKFGWNTTRNSPKGHKPIDRQNFCEGRYSENRSFELIDRRLTTNFKDTQIDLCRTRKAKHFPGQARVNRMVRLPATDHLRHAIQEKFQCLTTRDMHQIDTNLLRRNSEKSHTERSCMFDVGSTVRP